MQWIGRGMGMEFRLDPSKMNELLNVFCSEEILWTSLGSMDHKMTDKWVYLHQFRQSGLLPTVSCEREAPHHCVASQWACLYVVSTVVVITCLLFSVFVWMFVGRIHPKWTSLPTHMQRARLSFTTQNCWGLLRRGTNTLTTSSEHWRCATLSCPRSMRMVRSEWQSLQKDPPPLPPLPIHTCTGYRHRNTVITTVHMSHKHNDQPCLHVSGTQWLPLFICVSGTQWLTLFTVSWTQWLTLFTCHMNTVIDTVYMSQEHNDQHSSHVTWTQ